MTTAARKLKTVKPKHPKQTLLPGKAYRWANANKWMDGPWMVALSKTHFLSGDDGLCATFKTEAAALDAYAGKVCLVFQHITGGN